MWGMTVVEEMFSLFPTLPAEKARSVLDFARYLAEQDDDAAWERSIEAARNSPRFKQRLAEVEREISEGRSSPLDVDRL